MAGIVGAQISYPWKRLELEADRYDFSSIEEDLRAAKEAFPKSVVIQYANFMPGEWLPWTNSSSTKSQPTPGTASRISWS